MVDCPGERDDSTEVEVTREMRDAGERILLRYPVGEYPPDFVAERVYLAMEAARDLLA